MRRARAMRCFMFPQRNRDTLRDSGPLLPISTPWGSGSGIWLALQCAVALPLYSGGQRRVKTMGKRGRYVTPARCQFGPGAVAPCASKAATTPRVSVLLKAFAANGPPLRMVCISVSICRFVKASAPAFAP